MENDNEIMIVMENINKGYMLGEEKVPVLKDVCFQVKKGEFVAILGPSGSGKTTLMNIIGCMDIADSGEYFLDGNAIHEMEESELNDVRNKEIGFIFQNYQLISTYNILQNIIMPLVVRACPPVKRKKNVWILSGFWGWITDSAISPPSFREGRNRGFRSRGRWWGSLPFCWRMNLRELWTERAGRRC